jgi:hypothetical protein
MTSRTLQLQKKTAQTPIQSGHKTKKQRKADEAEEADKLARERRRQGNVSPDLSESFSDNATFQTLAGVVPGSEEEREADQTKMLNPPGRTAPPTPAHPTRTMDQPDVTTHDPTTTAEGLLEEECRSRSTSLPDDAQDDGGSRSTDQQSKSWHRYRFFSNHQQGCTRSISLQWTKRIPSRPRWEDQK